MVYSCQVAEVCPSPPNPVSRLVPRLLLRIQDASTVCNASVIQEKMALGRGEILKVGGIICGRRE
jgi:hypothetical protein